MSHWTVAKVQIKNPNMDLLKKALQIIAKELNVNKVVENYVVHGYRHSQQCQLAIPIRLKYGNGYGVHIDKHGNVNVVVDDHGAPLSSQQFANKLVQYYTALAIMQLAPQLGFQVSQVNELEKGIMIDLVR